MIQCPEHKQRMKPHTTRYGKRFECPAPDCDYRVGAHRDGRPLGTPANAAMRQARMEAHRAFDDLWMGCWKRADAYAWLAKELGIPKNDCHIGEFDIETCGRVVRICRDSPYPGE